MSSIHPIATDPAVVCSSSLLSGVATKVSHDNKKQAQSDVVVCGVIGPTSIKEMYQPCPCCNRRVSPSVEVRQTLDEPAGPGRLQDIPCLFDNFEEGHEEEYDEEDDYLPGVLESGVEYKFKRVLAEGWLNKKGSGKDWLRSRTFKPRWARLVVRSLWNTCFCITISCLSHN